MKKLILILPLFVLLLSGCSNAVICNDLEEKINSMDADIQSNSDRIEALETKIDWVWIECADMWYNCQM